VPLAAAGGVFFLSGALPGGPRDVDDRESAAPVRDVRVSDGKWTNANRNGPGIAGFCVIGQRGRRSRDVPFRVTRVEFGRASCRSCLHTPSRSRNNRAEIPVEKPEARMRTGTVNAQTRRLLGELHRWFTPTGYRPRDRRGRAAWEEGETSGERFVTQVPGRHVGLS
jgi:hypothetical protein